MTRRSSLVMLGVAALLAVHGWLAHSATRDKSPTYDEPLHLTAGYSYWRYQDFRLQPENGNLPQRWAALPLLLDQPTLPVQELEGAWRTSDAPRIQTTFLFKSGNDTERLLQRARAAALAWTILLGLLVFVWARQLWGEAAGWFALALHAVSPTMLAHGALVTSDMAAAFFLMAATGAYWRHLQRADAVSVGLSVLATGLAVVAKFSFVMLPFIYLVLAAWRVAAREPWDWTWRARVWSLGARSRVLGAIALSTVLHVAGVFVVVWTFFNWRFLPAGEGMPEVAQYYRLWSFTLPESGMVRAAIDLMRSAQLLPEAFIHGFSYVYAAAQERAAFLNSEFRATGWWWFFPYAFLVKTPLAELGAIAAVLVLAVLRWSRTLPAERRAMLRERGRPLLPLIALLAVYGLFSVTSRLNIGHRHLLPMYPAFLILAGGLVTVGAARWRRGLAVVLVAVALVESFAVRPHYLAFFNASVGGPANGWRHLVDSSLDWGQDLPGLSAWLAAERQPNEPTFVSVFGARDLAHYGITARMLAPEFALEPRRWVPLTGGVYAVSATMLQDVYSPWAGAWTARNEAFYQALARDMRARLADSSLLPIIMPGDTIGPNLLTLERARFARLVNYLRLRTPDAVIGYTVFVHRLTDAEARTVEEGRVEAYLELLESAR